jgi:hypothetical protein
MKISKRQQKITEQEQKKVDDWNNKYAVGQKVIVTKDDGSEFETETRYPAEVLSGHTAVGWFKGISGCYLLERARAAT